MQICRQRATDVACTPVASLPLQEVSHAPSTCPADALKCWDQAPTMQNSSSSCHASLGSLQMAQKRQPRNLLDIPFLKWWSRYDDSDNLAGVRDSHTAC